MSAPSVSSLGKRQLYEELGRQLGVTEAAELIEKTRETTIACLATALTATCRMKGLADLDPVGTALCVEGERLKNIAAKYVEDGIARQAEEADAAIVRNSGAERCPLCGDIGQHLCTALLCADAQLS